MLRRQTTICREGWYYLAIIAVVFGGAMLKEVNLLLILAGMLLGPLLLNWQAVRANLRGLKIDRNLPLRICAGDVLSVDLNLTNTRRRLGSWAVVVEEQIQREAANGRNNHRRHAAAAPQRAVSLCARRPVAQGRLPRPAGRARPLSFRTVAGFHAIPLRVVLPHDHAGRAGNADRVAAAGPADQPLGRRGGRRPSPARIAAGASRAPRAISTACASGAAATAGG